MTVAAISEDSMIGHNRPPIEEVLAEQHRDLIAKIEPLAARANALPTEINGDDELGPLADVVVDMSKLLKELSATRKRESEPLYQEWKASIAFFATHIERLEEGIARLEGRATAYNRRKIAEAKRIQEEEVRKLREAEDRKRQEAENAKRQTTADRKLDEAEDLADQAEEAEAKAQASNAELTKVRTDSGVTAGTRTVWNFQITDYDAIPLEKLRPFLKREHVESAIRSLVNIQKGSTSLEGVRVFEDIKSTFRR